MSSARPKQLQALVRYLIPLKWLRRLSTAALPPTVASDDDEAAYAPINATLVRRLLHWLWPYRHRYALGLGLGAVMVVLEMLSPQFMKAIINWTGGYLAGTLEPMPTEDVAIWGVIRIVAIWAVVLGTVIALQRATILIMTDAGERVQFDLRRALFAHLQRLSMSYFDRTKLGRIISRCTSDLNGLREINVWGIDTIVKNVLIMITAGAMLIFTDWRLFLAVVWLAPVLYSANHLYRQRISVAWQVVREGFTRVTTNLAENISGVRVVTAFARQATNLGRFNTLQDQHTTNVMITARINGVYQPLLNLIGFLGRAIVLLLGGYFVTQGRADVGSVVAAFLYWDWFMGPILTFGNFHNQLLQAMAGGERMFDLLDTQPEVRDRPDAAALPVVRGDVHFEDVTFGYKPDRPVLHEINFTATAGQTIALVGATGSGKSTIVSLLARFYEPQSGRICVDGHDLRHVTGESLHRQMALVSQTNFLFTGTVLENIRYGRPEATEQQVCAAAKAIGSYDAISGLKEGFTTEVGERGASVSLGQRQLICFTRAFLANPRILILDEATSSVDSVTELQIQRSLERLLERRTTFVVAHRLSTIKRADCILVIDAGRIIERGTHAELLRTEGKYARLYEQFVFSASSAS